MDQVYVLRHKVLVEGLSVRDVARQLGISRNTARRYLEYLEQRGQATLDLRYGSTGRPEHLYELVGERTQTRPER